jgi:protein-S-isoprenylcysteine O-methyltransferase Ste14
MQSSATFQPLLFHGPTSPPPGTGPAQSGISFGLLTLILWLIFVVYWGISAIGVKKNVHGKNRWVRGVGFRIFLVVAVILLINFFGNYQTQAVFGPAGQAIGVVLVAVGIAFAIWARRHLGTNWTGYPAMKENHELVTSGPYSFVRHPIYTGMLLAVFGSALVSGVIWLLFFIVFTIMFIWRIKVEEGFMMKLFPDVYPEYKKRTKALIPFVW